MNREFYDQYIEACDKSDFLKATGILNNSRNNESWYDFENFRFKNRNLGYSECFEIWLKDRLQLFATPSEI